MVSRTTVGTLAELRGEGPPAQAGMNRLCRSIDSGLAETNLSPAKEHVWGEVIWSWGRWWMKLFISADISKPGSAAGGEVRNLRIQLTTASPEAKTFVSSSFCQKGRNNMLSSKIACESMCFSSVSSRQTFLEICVCFVIVHYSVGEKGISEKSSYFPMIPAWYTTIILLCSLKSSIRVNYKYLEVHIWSLENAVFLVALIPLTRHKILTVWAVSNCFLGFKIIFLISE